MEFNYSQVVAPVGGVILYPEWPHEDQPVPPDQIKDTGYIRGNARDSGGIVGSASSAGQIG